MQGPSFSLRDVPGTLYVALVLNVVGALVMVTAVAAQGGELDFEKLQRWFVFNRALEAAFSLLLPLGFLELAKRQLGPSRALAITGSALLFIGLGWILLEVAIVLVEPKEYPESLYKWFGRCWLLVTAAGYLLLTLAADAWRRVTLAAVGITLLVLTTYPMPVIGDAINDLFDGSKTLLPRYVYALFRDIVTSVSLLFIAAALAARGRAIPEPRRAYDGLQLARWALIARLIAAFLFVLFLVGATKSPGAGKFLAIGAPAVAVITAVLFAIGFLQVASSRVPNLSSVLFALAAAFVLWWTFVQLNQVLGMVQMLRDQDSFGSERVQAQLAMFSIIGPLVGTAGMLLAAIGIQSYASRSGQPTLGSSIAGRLAGFVTLMVVAMFLQSGVIEPKSSGGALMMLLMIAVLNIGAIGVYIGILGLAASSIERPSVPEARLL